ncbi:glycosyl hydrolase family 2, sugar binding domain protein, partial [Pseudoflavonifractor capillosus ATCC 29799]
MRNSICLNRNWTFYGPKGTPETINLPHTWNAVDGQDGGNDYWRGTCTYETTFPMPEFDPDTQTVYLEFQGVNASADVELNGTAVIHHDGGYSTFRAEVAGLLQAENHMTVRVDNSVNDRVYPQKADFTFYGGIYRDVTLLVANKHHFDLDFFGGPGLRITPALDGTTGKIRVESWTNVENPTVEVILTDAAGATVATGQGADVTLDIPNVHLWDGVKDPYLYTATLRLGENGTAVDQISSR